MVRKRAGGKCREIRQPASLPEGGKARLRMRRVRDKIGYEKKKKTRRGGDRFSSDCTLAQKYVGKWPYSSMC